LTNTDKSIKNESAIVNQSHRKHSDIKFD